MKNNRSKIILAIDPCVRGFGYAVLEGPDRLVDWGVKTVADDKNSRCLKWVAHFTNLYQPDLVVVENYCGKGSRRCRRVQDLIDGIRNLASSRNIRTRLFSRNDVRAAFTPIHARTKHEIARVIGEKFSELVPHLPRYRTSSMNEDSRMNMFDATALALTYFHLENLQLMTAWRPPQLSFSAPGSVSPGTIQDAEDVRLSCPIRAFPWLRPEKISPHMSRRDARQGGTTVELKFWRY